MSDKTSMPCPACREAGSDKSGNHLEIFPSGKFCCAVHPRDKAHNRRIIELRPDLAPPPSPFIGNGHKSRELGLVVEKYPYHDQSGQEIYQVWRHDPKDFSQHRIIDGEARPTLEGIARVPYRLPEFLKSETVWIVEGEKDADSLAALDIVATCNAGGAGKWQAEWSRFFEGKHVVICGDNDAPGRKHVEQVAAMLEGAAKSIRRVEVPAPVKDISDHLAGMSDSEARAAVDELLRQPDPLDALLDARRFNLNNPPPRPVPVLTIDGKTIATSGNLVSITSQAKAGTTALKGSMMASLMEPTGDCLGLTGQNPDGLPVVHFDTEQSPFDHHAVVLQILKRAGREQEPEWLRSYCLAGVATKDRRKALAHEMKRAAISGKLRAVFIDGVADLCIDPNDSAEAFGLVEELHRLAIIFDCPIFCRLHENPGTETGKTRGHLGSQLERKAETNLRLSKDGAGITTVFTERSRHCHISRESGPRFAWDAAAGMHLSRGPGNAEEDKAKAQEIIGILAQVFTSKPLLSYGELRASIMQIRGITQRTAEKYIASLQPKFIHQTASGFYGMKT
jgi:5S rRNA maturation endonuclease (ribonuclease M5)